MNIFEAIYCNNDDVIERSFIASEAEMDITIAKATKDYYLESGLLSLVDDRVFSEAKGYDDETKSLDNKQQNIFVRAIKAICKAIVNFINDIIAAIANLFDGRENLKPEDYLESNTASIRLDKDCRKLEEIVDDEIRKGNKLLQAVSSKTGISDEKIDNWVRKGADRIAKLAPVIIPAATAFGFTQFFKHKEQKKLIEAAEKLAADGDTSDSKKNKQKMRIMTRMKELCNHSGNAVKDWAKSIKRAKKKAHVDDDFTPITKPKKD